MYLDRNARELVLRFAYAGQPMSGKTHSIRALMRLLKGVAVDSAILSPREEQGRTLYFDWASYRGGSVRGNNVRCQIVTVPGQATLARRRQLLIESADVVIFVVDSDPQRLAEARRSYHEIQPWLVREDRSTIPVIFQCNKRDLPSAAPLDRIREQLGLQSSYQLFESTATSGKGIRLAFIAALRAACVQVEELRELQRPNHATQVDSGEQLLELIERMEAAAAAPETPRAVPAPPTAAARSANVPPTRVADAPSKPATAPTPMRAAAAPRIAAPSHAAELPEQSTTSLQPPRRDPPQQDRQQPEVRWSGQEPRPAIIPAADWHAFVRTQGRAAPAKSLDPRPAVERPVTATAATRAPVDRSSSATPPPQKSSVQPPTFKSASARPAVMPIGAWRAWLQSNTSAVPTSTPGATQMRGQTENPRQEHRIDPDPQA